MEATREQATTMADLIVVDAKVTTQAADGRDARAFAVKGEHFLAVGDEAEVMRFRDKETRVISARGHRVIPGLNDSHLHAVRGGLNFNLELRWDGVIFLQEGLQMIAAQAKRTPADQWVRVMGGWTPYQFVEIRAPTVAELNAAAPQTPVLVLLACSECLINEAGVKRNEGTSFRARKRFTCTQSEARGSAVKKTSRVRSRQGSTPTSPSFPMTTSRSTMKAFARSNLC
jgi:predicted amidohydrolase YtcJ